MRILELSIPHATDEGTFHSATKLLQSIGNAGFNVVYVLPWFKINRRASPSPYAVVDYYFTNEMLGNIKDAAHWIRCCHDYGLEVVLDIPLNHTSPFHSWRAKDDWYARNEQGEFHAPRGTAWSDVLQLNHQNPQVSKSCAEVLQFWLEQGVDGFRLDAASFISGASLTAWSTVLNRAKHVWCDDVQLAQRYRYFTSFFNHGAFLQAQSNVDAWKDVIASTEDCGILYLSNHDTLLAGRSPRDQWGIQYESMRSSMVTSTHHHLLSWSDWKDPDACYSFLNS